MRSAIRKTVTRSRASGLLAIALSLYGPAAPVVLAQIPSASFGVGFDSRDIEGGDDITCTLGLSQPTPTDVRFTISSEPEGVVFHPETMVLFGGTARPPSRVFQIRSLPRLDRMTVTFRVVRDITRETHTFEIIVRPTNVTEADRVERKDGFVFRRVVDNSLLFTLGDEVVHRHGGPSDMNRHGTVVLFALSRTPPDGTSPVFGSHFVTANAESLVSIADDDELPFLGDQRASINDAGSVAFWVPTSTHTAIMRCEDGRLRTYVDTSEDFRVLHSSPVIGPDGRITFGAETRAGTEGIFRGRGVPGSPLVEGGDAASNFVASDSGTIAFLRFDGQPRSVAVLQEGEVTTVADPGSLSVETPNLTTFLLGGVNDGGTAAFFASHPGIGVGGGTQWVLSGDGGPVTPLATNSASFDGFSGRPSIDLQGRVAFFGRLANGGTSLWTGRRAPEERVIGTGDQLFGETVAGFAGDPVMNSIGQIAFRVSFERQLATGEQLTAIVVVDPDRDRDGVPVSEDCDDGDPELSDCNTPAGSGTIFEEGDVKITFWEIVFRGQTEVTVGECDVDPPPGYKLVPASPSNCYEITTTAAHAGIIELCISYDGLDLGVDEEMLEMMHCTGPTEDECEVVELQRVDTNNKLVCGIVDGFSTFAILVPSDDGARFRRGDATDDESLDLTDGIFILGFLFRGEARPDCLAASDSNGDRSVDVTDAVYLFSFLFLGRPPAARPVSRVRRGRPARRPELQRVRRVPVALRRPRRRRLHSLLQSRFSISVREPQGDGREVQETPGPTPRAGCNLAHHLIRPRGIEAALRQVFERSAPQALTLQEPGLPICGATANLCLRPAVREVGEPKSSRFEVRRPLVGPRWAAKGQHGRADGNSREDGKPLAKDPDVEASVGGFPGRDLQPEPDQLGVVGERVVDVEEATAHHSLLRDRVAPAIREQEVPPEHGDRVV